MKSRYITYLAAFLAALSSNAQNVQQSDEEVTFRTHTRILASDEFGGRKPLSSYEPLTLDYIAGEYKKLGLLPANGDSYLQDVPLIDVTVKPKGGKITVKGPKGTTVINDYDDAVIWTAQKDKTINVNNAEFVFVGFGINAPEYGWNDYEGLDVKGKVVVALVNDPGYYDASLFKGKSMTYYGRWIYKFEEASRQGAAGVLVVHDTKPATYGWNTVQPSWYEHNLELVNDKDNRDLVRFKGWITREKATELFVNAGYSYDELLQKALKKGFKAISLNSKSNVKLTNNVSGGISHNVAAILPGSDPDLKDEYVIYSAHWDHFGVGKPVNGDSIYNGASDNATGVAAVLTIAKRLAELGQRPRRSILFLAVTAEEAVLLGSQHYVTHPLVPLDKTVAVLNFDGVGPAPATRDVIIHNENTGYEYVHYAAAAQGRHVVTQPGNTGYRSDHFSFNRVGVPTVSAPNGREYIAPNPKTRDRSAYHQPNDEYHEDWDVSGSLQSIDLHFSVGYQIANADKRPEWNRDSEYRRGQ